MSDVPALCFHSMLLFVVSHDSEAVYIMHCNRHVSFNVTALCQSSQYVMNETSELHSVDCDIALQVGPCVTLYVHVLGIIIIV